MILKRFNENFHDSDFDLGTVPAEFHPTSQNKKNEDNFQVIVGETLRDAIKRAKTLAMKKNIIVKFTHNGIPIEVTKNSNSDNIEDDFVEKFNNKYPKYKIPKKSKDKESNIDTGKQKIVRFNTTLYDVVGLPSGQILYMTTEQIKWMKSRNYIMFVKTWKKPTTGGGIIPKEINKYAFEDAKYNEILEMLEIIEWR